jgi:HSP20 family protein
MTLVRKERMGLDWMLPERWWRMFDVDADVGRWMRVEEFREDGTLVVRAELPDIDPERDVEVEVRDGVLHIRASRTQHEEHRDKEGYRSEFRYGNMERDLLLPPGVDGTGIAATYKDGVLEVRVPVPTESGPTKVTVARA